MRIEQGADRRGVWYGGKASVEMSEHPIGVYARMPVEAAVEDRVQIRRAARAFRTGQDMVQSVGVLARDVSKSDRGE